MLTCPMCKKALTGLPRHCPRCRTDLTLLVDYVSHLGDGLARAEALTRGGQLGEAVWAYLEVLEVDPDNAVARRQVGRVATAVRQFDRAAPGRRWLNRLRRRAQFRQWLHSRQEDAAAVSWFRVAGVVILIVAAAALGYELGRPAQPREGSLEPPAQVAPE
jgi:hypothetical protein